MQILELALEKFFPVIMLVGIIASGFLVPLTGDKPEVLIAVIGTLATIFSVRRNFQKIELKLFWNGRKIPDWALLLIAAAKGIANIVLLSLILSLFFRTSVIFQVTIIAPFMALMENRKNGLKFLVISREIVFQFVLIVQIFVIISITGGKIALATIAIPLSFLLCLWTRRIERKIEEQINARQDHS